MTNKKNKFLTFCFSLLPGAGEMYLGFYKMGISLMAVFWLIIAITGYLNTPLLSFLLPVVWFYSFFHVHNLNSMQDEEFYALEDGWLFHINVQETSIDQWIRRNQKVVAVVLVIFGLSIIWNLFNDLLFQVLNIFNLPDQVSHLIRRISHTIPQSIIGIFIVYTGILLIRGKKKDLDQESDSIIPAPPYVSYKDINESEKPENPAD